MRNLNLDQLQTLVAVADLGTLAAAAQDLHLAPPTVSLHLKELESRVRAQLVVRGRKKAALTAAGSLLVEEGRKLLVASDDLIDLARRRASGREAVVRIGVSAGTDTRLLPAMLEALGRRNADIDIRLEAAGSAETMQRLRSGQLDIGMVGSPQPAVPELCLVPWREDVMVALLPSVWNAPELVTPEWLASRPWTSFEPGTHMHRLVATWFGQAGLHPRPYLTLSYPNALRSLVVTGRSAAILPLEEVQDLHGAPDVQLRHLQPPLMRPMAIAHRRPPISPAVGNVLEVLAEFANEVRTSG